MFGLPMWLINFLFTLIVQWGIPVVQKMVPSIPAEIWACIKDFLSHVHQQPVPAKVEKAEQFRTAVNKITKTKKA